MCTSTCTHVYIHMYTCVHPHVHMCTSTCTHVYIHMYTCVHPHVHMCTSTCTHVYIHMYTCVHPHVHMCTSTCTHVYIHMYTCVHPHVHMCTSTCTHVYIHMYTCVHPHVHLPAVFSSMWPSTWLAIMFTCSGQELPLDCGQPLVKLKDKCFGHVTTLEKQEEVTVDNKVYTYCELRPTRTTQGKFNQIMTFLAKRQIVSVRLSHFSWLATFLATRIETNTTTTCVY